MYAYVHALTATIAVCDRSHTCPLQHALFTLRLGSTTDSRLPTHTATRTRTGDTGTTTKHRHIRNSVPYRHTDEQGNKKLLLIVFIHVKHHHIRKEPISSKTLAESITVGRGVVQTFFSKHVPTTASCLDHITRISHVITSMGHANLLCNVPNVLSLSEDKFCSRARSKQRSEKAQILAPKRPCSRQHKTTEGVIGTKTIP